MGRAKKAWLTKKLQRDVGRGQFSKGLYNVMLRAATLTQLALKEGQGSTEHLCIWKASGCGSVYRKASGGGRTKVVLGRKVGPMG